MILILIMRKCNNLAIASQVACALNVLVRLAWSYKALDVSMKFIFRNLKL